MASIEDLTEDVCEALTGVEVGDLVFVKVWVKYPPREGGEGEDEDADNTGGNDAGHGEQEDQDGADDEGGAGEVPDEYYIDPYIDDGQHLMSEVLIIDKVTKDEGGIITKIHVRRLMYCKNLADASNTSYHLYGPEVVVSAQDSDANSTHDIRGHFTHDNVEYELIVNPDGDFIRNNFFHRECPANCTDGWLRTQEEAQNMVTDVLVTLNPHRPVCPACMGKDLMKEYHSLRMALDIFPMINLAPVADFYSRLNPRRRALGRRFKQFDEREWGYLFDDMLSEEDEDEDGADDWDYYNEALEPNNDVILRPASDAAIASLTRKTFGEVEGREGQLACLVCMADFEDGDAVVVMPCQHVFCAAGCLDLWLKNFNSCPTCRAKLPAKEDEAAVNEVVAGSRAEDEEDVEKDDEDVVMSDEVGGDTEPVDTVL